MRFNSIVRNTKLIQHLIITSFALQLGRIGYFEKQIKVISIEHLKQNLSLENNKRHCYNDVNKSKTVV